MSVLGLMLMLSGHAQNQSVNDGPVFNTGKMFASAQFSNLNMNYTGYEKFHMDLGAKLGAFIADDIMVGASAQVGYFSRGDIDNVAFQETNLGGFMRYYIEQNGLYLGVGANWAWKHNVYNDFQPEVNAGYAFFISHTVTIEPELYYRQSFVCHSKYSSFGLRLGIGIYLDDIF